MSIDAPVSKPAADPDSPILAKRKTVKATVEDRAMYLPMEEADTATSADVEVRMPFDDGNRHAIRFVFISRD